MSDALDRKRLFLVGNLSIFMIGLGFAVRASIASDIQNDLFNQLDLARSAGLVGEVLGATFIGFALTLLFGSALVDRIGMRAMLLFSALGYIIGSALVLAVSFMPVSMLSYWLIFAGFLLTGLGWGAVEAASNPMVTAVYPEEKTHRLNILHAWWPAGIVVGGIAGLAFAELGLPWQVNLLMLVLPACWLAYLTLSTQFPVSERVQSGVSYGDMFKELFRAPGYFIWFFCMMITAAAELAPGQWVDLSLTNIVGMPGILVLIYVSMLMFVMRHFAGAIAKHISSVGLLFFGCIFAALGLYGLSLSTSPLTAFLSATVWGMGVCYFWPTMLSVVSERYPKGGALFLGLTGFAAGLSIQFVLPQMGAIFDSAKIEAAGGVARLSTLGGEELDAVLRYASVESFQAVAILPLLLLPVFGLVWWRDRRQHKE
ncbi:MULTISPECIES: MFS transporter [Spongiibacter]|uniref:MFS transporter n=1 Tax=Spongiibacter TaxID=630749 RepID=UPI0003B66453|nr:MULTISPECIES: MFS transporter [Spongiibacter]MBO6754310.1 MFS transporter [Spongiibacter sp.]MBU71252.1 MFS transporter [Spongiibacter sp.]|tara:strand:- start:13722 stop:15005 length:1284 start_codon:yes stop_codon:yes gene_type:complete